MKKYIFLIVILIFNYKANSRETAIEAVDTENLRVCADPANLPFSNDKSEGYENEIADLIGEKLNIPVVYDYMPQVIGYVRETLNKKKCDIIIGITGSNDLVLNTVPYMRWSYAMVFLKDNGIDVDRPDHPQLADLRIGAVAGTPPTFILQRYNLMSKVRPYNLTFDPRVAVIGETMIEDLIDGLVDINFMSAPIASHYHHKKGYGKDKFVLIPLETTDQGWGRMDFYTTMGVRDGETDWKKKLNNFIKDNQKQINAILVKHNIPILKLRPGKRKKSEDGGTTDALIRGRAPVK